jgi:iron complex outermembrane recepter protein
MFAHSGYSSQFSSKSCRLGQALIVSTTLACLSLLSPPALAGDSLDQEVTWNIPAESLSDALVDFGRVANVQMLVDGTFVQDRTSSQVKGTLSARAALETLLWGSGLSYKVKNKTVTVAPVGSVSLADARPIRVADGRPASDSDVGAVSDGPTPASPGDTDFDDSTGENGTKLEQVVVTGTSIRGVTPVGSPLTIYSRSDIDETGAGTLDQFARSIPGNFPDVDTVANSSSNASHARFNAASDNIYGGAAFDLHGIGPSATLTLLNGQRMAPAGESGSLTDVSMIPLSAIDHVEILDDGASAIYGADAVAGVVNVITRKQFEGAETGVRYGVATAGGDIQTTASQLLGHAWGTGSILLDYEYSDQGGLDASQRSYIPDLGGPNSLIPENRRNTVFISGSQEIDLLTTVSLDGIYSVRHFDSQSTEVSSIPLSVFTANQGEVKQYGGTLKIDRQLGGDWHASASGNISKVIETFGNTADLVFSSFSEDTGHSIGVDTGLAEGGVSLNGSLFSLPGGAVKAAFGAAYRGEGFSQSYLAFSGDSQTISGVPSLSRRTASAYAEVFVPVIGDANALPGARRVELSASGRYDHYSDFGSTSNPKVGLLWEPVRGMNLRGSYGTSFRAPELSEKGTLVTSQTEQEADPTSPTGFRDALLVSGGKAGLGPETAKSFTGGFDVTPSLVPNFKLAVTYFNIRFTNRIAVPPVVSGNFLNDPIVAPFVTRDPPLSLVESYFNSPGFEGDNVGGGPAAVTAIFDGRYANISSTKSSGVQLGGTYAVPTNIGRFAVGTDVARLLDDTYQTAAGSPAAQLLNTYAEPTSWKIRSNISWAIEHLNVVGTVNYVGSYQNSLFTPQERISSWTTGDLYISYKTDRQPSSPLLQGIDLSLSILNITDRRPPYAPLPSADLLPGQAALPFDPANASPLGRIIALSLTKRW